jgi:hypothetical protein
MATAAAVEGSLYFEVGVPPIFALRVCVCVCVCVWRVALTEVRTPVWKLRRVMIIYLHVYFGTQPFLLTQ